MGEYIQIRKVNQKTLTDLRRLKLLPLSYMIFKNIRGVFC